MLQQRLGEEDLESETKKTRWVSAKLWSSSSETRFHCRRKRKVEGRGKGKEEEGKGEMEIGSEALAETGKKIVNAPAGNWTQDPSNCGWCSIIEPSKLAGDVACLGGSLEEHQPRLLGSRVRFLAGVSAVFFPFLPKLHFQFPFLLSLLSSFPFPSRDLPSTFHLRLKRTLCIYPDFTLVCDESLHLSFAGNGSFTFILIKVYSCPSTPWMRTKQETVTEKRPFFPKVIWGAFRICPAPNESSSLVSSNVYLIFDHVSLCAMTFVQFETIGKLNRKWHIGHCILLKHGLKLRVIIWQNPYCDQINMNSARFCEVLRKFEGKTRWTVELHFHWTRHWKKKKKTTTGSGPAVHLCVFVCYCCWKSRMYISNLTSPLARSWSMHGWPSLGQKMVYLPGNTKRRQKVKTKNDRK